MMPECGDTVTLAARVVQSIVREDERLSVLTLRLPDGQIVQTSPANVRAVERAIPAPPPPHTPWNEPGGETVDLALFLLARALGLEAARAALEGVTDGGS